jgi:hypothetical protein
MIYGQGKRFPDLQNIRRVRRPLMSTSMQDNTDRGLRPNLLTKFWKEEVIDG